MPFKIIKAVENLHKKSFMILSVPYTYKKSLCVFLFLFNQYCNAQIWQTGMADPILNVTFGDGKNNPGPTLPAGKTTYRYTSDLCPKQGEYTIARNNLNCSQNSNWNQVYRDHTFLLNGSAYEGYMMLVDGSSSSPEVFYTDTVNNLCSNNTYLLSAAVTTVGKCINTIESPNILFRVKTKSGREIEFSGPGYQNWL